MASANMNMPPGAPAALISAPINFNTTLGAAFLGLIFAAILFGITNIQSFIYYQNSTRDPVHVRWTIAFLWLLDALHLALITHAMYFYLVTNFMNILAFTKPTWSLCLLAVVITISDTIVRFFYSRRVWIMSRRNWFLTIGTLVLTITASVSGLGFAIKLFTFTSLLQLSSISWLLYLSLGSGVATDLWIAISLCFFLVRNRTGFKATDSKINVIIMYIINTGLLTGVCAVCSFITYAAMPQNYIFMGFLFNFSKLYFNALLATLNSRDRLREGTPASSNLGSSAYQIPRMINGSSSSGMALKHDTSFGTVSASRQNNFDLGEKENQTLAVNVQMETDYHTDVDGVEMKPVQYGSSLAL